MSDRIKIRRASRYDLASVASMINKGRELGGFLQHASRCTASSLAAYMKKMRAFYPYYMLVLDIDGDVRGYVDFCELDGGVGYLIGIFIRQDNRRRGRGAKLLQQALKLLRNRGCHKVRSEVYITNQPAALFCKREGFVKEGLLRNDEGHHTLVIWSKTLAK